MTALASRGTQPASPGSRPACRLARRKQQRIKLLNIMVPTIAALVGALIGAGASIIATVYQVNANQTQTASSILRSQRQVAYNTFLTDANQLGIEWSSYIFGRSAKAASEVASADGKLGIDYSNLYTLGPDVVTFYCFRTFGDISQLEHEAGISLPGSAAKSFRSAQTNASMRQTYHSFGNDLNDAALYMGKTLQDVSANAAN
jgi:hypothetical protein